MAHICHLGIHIAYVVYRNLIDLSEEIFSQIIYLAV